MTRIQLLAQSTDPTAPPEIEVVEPSRPVSDFLAEVFDLDRDGWIARTLEALVEPVAQIAIILVVAWVATSVLRRVSQRVVDHAIRRSARRQDRVGAPPRRNQRLEALGSILNSAIAVVVWGVALLTILGTTFGISLAPFLAGAGILGIALGFGAQDLVKDFLSGAFMLLEDQFGVGDIVDSGAATGVVESVSLRTTRLRDVNGTVWHIPNGEIRRVGNLSQEWSRALLDVGVAYGADIDRAAQVIEAVAAEMAREEGYRGRVLGEPEVWGVEDLGVDSVAIRLAIRTKPGEQWAISRELRRRVKLALDEAGIEIPFPQRTMWLRTPDEAESVT